MSEELDSVDVGDDALQSLISEAENLMTDLDKATEPVVGGFEGFSIDSDEEEEGDPLSVLLSEATADASASETEKAPVADHPLSSEHLPSATTPTMATASSLPSLFNANTANGLPNSAAVPSMDSFKQHTTRFASGLASMAQRAANQVAAATAPVQVAGAPNVYSPSAPAPTYPAQMPKVASTPTNVGVAPPHPAMDNEQKQQLIREHVGELLPGERVIMFLSNLLHVSDTSGLSYHASQHSPDSHMWCCVMSFYRLILFSTAAPGKLDIPCPDGWNPTCWPVSPSATKILEMPLASIDRVEKTVYSASGSSYMGIVVHGKDCARTIRFTTPSYKDTGRAFDSLNTYAFPGRRNIGYLFAFESRRQQVMASMQVDANGNQIITLPPNPKRFDPSVEYPRLLSDASITNAPWAIWDSINATYQLSPTYPSVLVGPSTLKENTPEAQHIIRQCASFRSEQRLPAMSWCGVGGSSIWRASQPKVGLQGNRSPADELFLRHVAESARGANAMADPAPVYPRSLIQQLTGDYSKDWVPEPGCTLKILDLRPRSAAMANRTGGYGYENTSNYSNCTLQFCNIANIHAVRDAYQKLCSVCNSESTTDVNFNSLVEDTKWLSLIRVILAASWETAFWAHVWRMPVLVHCSHGWDRTSQVSALAQLILDPYYRTRYGFSVLVEKEFMSFGHPFHLRSAHGESRNPTNSQSSGNDEGQISPIFLQFLDCVYQLVQWAPDSFEFTAAYLLEFSFHIYSCRFGNLLCDSERERETQAGIRQRTFSVWDHLEGLADGINPKFQAESNVGVLLMPLPTLLRNVRLWSERHCFCALKPSLRPIEAKQ
eukprot:Nitzschia sp. Nitz4//scaffold13_size275219//97220//99789//NITZ4_000863-RA/size275219-augustus-gene-0.229-mRNA-1//1//CDS//3329535981//7426//frame0